MNYLAHLLLAKQGQGSAIGSLLADFTRIPSSRLSLHFEEEIASAIILHRRIDSFTDSHSDVASACHHLFRKYRHWSRVIIDIAFDYFLSKHWSSYSDFPFDDFIRQSYSYLRDLPPGMPVRYQRFTQRLISHDALRAYCGIEQLKIVFDRLQNRINSTVLISGAWEDIVEHHEAIEYHFHSFFPQVISFADGEKERMGSVTSGVKQ